MGEQTGNLRTGFYFLLLWVSDGTERLRYDRGGTETDRAPDDEDDAVSMERAVPAGMCTCVRARILGGAGRAPDVSLVSVCASVGLMRCDLARRSSLVTVAVRSLLPVSC